MKKIFLCIIFLLSFSVVDAAGCEALLTRDAAEFIGDIVTVVRIGVPILLVVLCSTDFVAIVTGQDESVTKKSISRIVKRFICAAAFFFVPLILQFILGLDVVNNALNLVDDPSCGLDGDLDGYKTEEEIQKETEKKLEEERKKKEEEKKKKEEEEKKKQEEANKKKATKTIYIGDSRTVGMCASLSGGNYTKCAYKNYGNKPFYINSNEIFISQGSMAYSWFNSTAVPAVNKILSDNPNTVYNIVSYMGVNGLLGDVDKYVSKYKELANGAWKNHNFIIVSVNPVNETKEASHGYKVKQASIVKFNDKIKSSISSSNASYCDIYNKILNDFDTTDGLHYTSGTYKKIYNHTQTCISNTTIVTGSSGGEEDDNLSNLDTGKGYGKATNISISYNVKDSLGRCGKGSNDYCAAVATVKYPKKTVKFYMGYQNNSGLLDGSCRSHAFMAVANAVNGTKYSTLDLQKYLYSINKNGVLKASGIPKALKKYDLEATVYHEETNISKAAELMEAALNNGQPVMIFVANSKCSDIAGSHHALLLLGYDKNGNVIFIDSVPYARSAKKRNVKQLANCLSGNSIAKSYYRMIIFSYK